jgi:tetratricopeptide (TPR) repeat protein
MIASVAVCELAAQTPSTTPVLKPAVKPGPTPAKTPGKPVTGPPKTLQNYPATNKRPLEAPWPALVTAVPDVLLQNGTPVRINEPDAREFFEKAMALLRQRKPEDAIPLLREAEKIEPKRYEIQMGLGAAFGMLNRIDDAVSAFQKAVSFKPQSAPAHSALCKALAISHKPIEAVDECREAVRLAPNESGFQAQLADLYAMNGDTAAAIQMLQIEVAASQNDLRLHAMLGDMYYYEGEYAMATEVYERIRTAWPAISPTYYRLSIVYGYLDRPTDAIAAARKFAELEPTFVIAQLNLGETLNDWGFVDESIEPLQKAIAIDLKCGEAYWVLSESYEVMGDKENRLANMRQAYKYLKPTALIAYKFGAALSDYGNSTDAIEPLERANSLDPDNPDILFILGLTYIDVNRYDEGIEMMERSEQLRPPHPNVTVDLTRVKARNEILARFDQILEYARKNPNDMRARYELGEVYVFKGMLKEAEQEFLAMLKLAPNDYRNYNGLGVFYSEHGEFEKALVMTQKAIELNPHHVLYLTASYLLIKLGRFDEALAAAKRSVEIKSTLLESRLWLGDLYLKKGLRADALREFQAGFELASGDQRPNYKLAWLYIRMGNKEGAFRHYAILKGIAPSQLKYLERCLRAHFGSLPN